MRTKVETLLKKDKTKEIEEAAYETSSWIQDAVGDLLPRKGMVDKARRDSVQDIRGWSADEYYNDEDTLSDLLGDHIFDHATALAGIKDPAFSACYIKICEAMLPGAHTAMANVLKRFITEKKNRL